MKIRWAFGLAGVFLLGNGFGLVRAESVLDPGAPFQGQVLPARVDLLENIQEESSTSLQSVTPLGALVTAGALIVTEPAEDIATGEIFSRWSDVVIFANTTATLYSNIFPVNNDNSFQMLDGTIINLPTNRLFGTERVGTDADQAARNDAGFTTYVAGDPAVATNTYRINSVSPVPEPASFMLMGLGCLGLLGYGWRCRQRAVA